MDRKSGRQLATDTLTALGLFGQVEKSEPDVFDAALIAVVHSKSLSILQEARNLLSSPAEIWVTIFVRRAAGAEDAAEDLLDDLVRAAARALYDAFYPLAENLQIVSAAGKPEKSIDGKNYRMERFSVRWNDDDD